MGLLDDIYYKDFNYGGINSLYRKAKELNNKITLNDVKEFLKKQPTYQQNFIKVSKKEYKPIYSESPYAFQIDLTFLPKYKSYNNGNYILFTAINVNSRYAYAYYSKDKNTDTIIDIMELFLKNCLMIDTITCDEGSEFTNKKIVEWFNKNNIKVFYVLKDSHKLGIINRFHRTLKEKLLKYFVASDDLKWIDVIDKIIESYNNTFNRGIGMTPNEASKGFNQSIIVDDMREKEIINIFNFNVGDKCRVKTKQDNFTKMKPRYSKIIYTITKVNKNTVNLVDDDGDDYNGIKKEYILIVDNNTKTNDNNILEEANKLSKIDRKLQKELKNLK